MSHLGQGDSLTGQSVCINTAPILRWRSGAYGVHERRL